MGNLRNWLLSRKTDDKSVVLLLVKGYVFLTFLCFLILQLPFCQNASNSLVNHFFFSVSIVSTTGLAPADFATSYSLAGQIASLIFIQLGGVGYMALSSFIILKQKNRLPHLSIRLLKLEFNLPNKYPIRAFIYSVFGFTLLIETIGAIFLSIGFRNEGLDNPIWNGIFHSVSAFCTAGFSLFNDSMSSFSENAMISNTILVLSLLGSIGFIVLLDFWLRLFGKRKSLTLTTKVILFSTFSFWIIASIAIFFSDSNLLNSGWEGARFAIFQGISAHTTVGFNNYDLETLSSASNFIIIILMIIGASPAGTGGGIKTTSITSFIAVLKSILRRDKYVKLFNREIPAHSIYLAISSAIFYSFILMVGTWIVLMIEGSNFNLEGIIFEVSSALSTVGLSTGITAELSSMSKLVISLLMLIGRLGVITFGFALISKAPEFSVKPLPEEIAI